MKIYTASFLFISKTVPETFVQHRPTVATSYDFPSFDIFIAYCRKEIQEDELFAISDTFISAVEFQQLEDGKLQKISSLSFPDES